MAIFHSYELHGRKLSFANWISNISPEETPFVSSTGKEAIDQIRFSWQVDRLAAVNPQNAVLEGSDAGDGPALKPTDVLNNNTQILRKVVFVSDTANATTNYGRGRELMYQLEKAGAEIKRDLEASFLQNGPAVYGAYPPAAGAPGSQDIPGGSGQATAPTAGDTGRITAGFRAQVGLKAGAFGTSIANDDPDTDTGAVVYHSAETDTNTAVGFNNPTVFESALFGLTAQLYLAGAKADTLLVHPALAGAFSQLQNTGSQGNARVRYFENTKSIVLQVNTITDPLGQTFKVVYDRFMPHKINTTNKAIVDEAYIYAFSSSDWTQMVMRAPQRTQLAKTGSAEKWMIEMEVGLRHRNPYASGVVKFVPKP